MPEAVIDSADSPWRSRLYARLREQAAPLLVFEDGITPAGSLWAGTRLWTAAFREAGLRAGDRVVLALPPSPGFLCALLAGFWDGLTVALLNPAGDVNHTVGELDAAASIGTGAGEVTWRASACGLPEATGMPLRRPQFLPTPDARLLLATSGTTDAPRWLALSDTNIWAVLDSHRPHLNFAGARLLSVLPWHHVFGLVIELLPCLLAGAEIIRDSQGGRDPAQMVQLMRAHEITHLNAVPVVIERLLQTSGGETLVGLLHGGVIGGAPVRASLAKALRLTNLRAGYGQTEASPGIALGVPGCWHEGYLGRPLGCDVKIDADGRLHFSGPNACLGHWSAAGLERLEPDRWVDTGDLVRAEGRDLFFMARADNGFKLSNGRFVPVAYYESLLNAQAPQLGHVLLHSPDGERLELVVAGAPAACALSLAQARALLGPLGNRLAAMQGLPIEQWVKTAKGDIDRRATIYVLQQSLLPGSTCK